MNNVISRNHIKGQLINSVEEVFDLAKQKKGIYVSSWNSITPAAFLINWQAGQLVWLIKNKRLHKIIPIKTIPKKMWYELKQKP